MSPTTNPALPPVVCAWCGRWRDPHDRTLWHPAETLAVDTSSVSHGMCPDCRQEHTAAGPRDQA